MHRSGGVAPVHSFVVSSPTKFQHIPRAVTMGGVCWCGVVWCAEGAVTIRQRPGCLAYGCGVVWCGVVWCGMVRRGMAWCGVVWCGVVWCGVVWCGVVWHSVCGIWFVMLGR